jgi:hypothetical protein
MPVALIAAGVAAAGSVAGAAISSSAAKKAAKTQADASAQSNALAREQYASNAANLNPAIARGNQAAGYVGDLLGIGGDPAASQAAFQRFRDSSGYQFQLSEGLGAINANAYARGMGDSGATLKALQDRGNAMAQGSFQTYLGNLQNVSNQGTTAASALAGVGQNLVSNVTANNNQSADAAGNAALVRANGINGSIQNLINAGAYAYGSSYGQKPAAIAPPANTNTPWTGGWPWQTVQYGGR